MSEYYRQLAERSPAVSKIYTPSLKKLYGPESQRKYETPDPLNERAHMPLPRLVHRYEDRALILITDICYAYCSHCFRNAYVENGKGPITSQELESIYKYLKTHTEIKEILISGGDPLTLPETFLLEILTDLRQVRQDITIRLCTRAPVTAPGKISAGLITALAELGNLWIATQFNHPDELTPEAETICRMLTSCHLHQEDNGTKERHHIPILNQTVLLKNINDDVNTLATLFRGLVSWGIKPYYLFQGDLALGTAKFRTSLERSFGIAEELERKLSGIAMPIFAVDLPGGGGKIRLSRSAVSREDKNWYYFKGREGGEYRYPKEN